LQCGPAQWTAKDASSRLRGLQRRFCEAAGTTCGARRTCCRRRGCRWKAGEAVGFGSAATLRLHCGARLGATPRELRGLRNLAA